MNIHLSELVSLVMYLLTCVSHYRRTPMSRRPKPPPKPKTAERFIERDPVEVYCRIRPPETPNQEECVRAVDSRTVKVWD